MSVSRRPQPPSALPSNEDHHGNRLVMYNPAAPAALPVIHQPAPPSSMPAPLLAAPPTPQSAPPPAPASGLIDLSRRAHSSFPPNSAAPPFSEMSKVRHYMPAAVTVVESIDLSKRTNISVAQYSLPTSASPTLIDFSQKRAHAHGCPTTATSAFSTHSTYALDHSLRRNVTSYATGRLTIIICYLFFASDYCLALQLF